METLPTNHHLHDKIVNELLEHKTLSSLIWLINMGRELEFSFGGQSGFISQSGSDRYVSLCFNGEKQSFDSMEQLLEYAVLDGNRLMDVWNSVQLDFLF